MVEENELKQVIKFKTGVCWGIQPLPETTFKLITEGAEDKVQIVHTIGPSKKSITIKVPNGTYSHWIRKLRAIEDGQMHLDSMRVSESPRFHRRPIASFHATISSTSRCA